MIRSYEFDRVFLAFWTILVCGFVLMPLVFVVLVSLTPMDHISMPEGGLSLRWYKEMLNHPKFLEAGLNSIHIALKAAATALILGTLAALAVVRYTFRFRSLVKTINTSPLFVPMVMSGLAVLMWFSAMGWTDQSTRVYAAHTALTLPYVFRTVSASMAGFDINQELAARNLGAHPVKAFLMITVPQLGPGMVAGTVFAFIVSFDNVGMSIFVAGSRFSTLPVELFNHAMNSNSPMTAAISVVMIVFSFLAIVILERLFGLQKVMA